MSIPQSGGGPIERYEQLAEYMASGCKPKADWRIGTEHEKFGYARQTLLPAALRRPLLDQGHAGGPARPLRLGPGRSRAATSSAWRKGRRQRLARTRRPAGTVRRPAGDHPPDLRRGERAPARGPRGRRPDRRRASSASAPRPIWTHDQMPLMPKGRYKLMNAYMGKVGTHGTQMMRRTCTVQVNLDFASEADMVQKLRVALALQPVATALFANSPFFEGKPERPQVLAEPHLARSRRCPRPACCPSSSRTGMGFERYVDYVLDVPMYFVYRDGNYIDALGQSFRDFLKGELPALPGEKPTLSRLGRPPDHGLPRGRGSRSTSRCAAPTAARGGGSARLPALWVGLIYDQSRARCRLGPGARTGMPRRARRCASPPRSTACRRDPRRGHARSGARGAGDRRSGAEGPGQARRRRHDPGRDAFPERAEGKCRDRPDARRTSCWRTTTATGPAT